MLTSPSEQADLRWYWTEADGALGLRAIQYGADGRRSDGDASWQAIESAHGRIAAVVRWRRVHTRLAMLTSAQRQALFMVYGWTKPMPGRSASELLLPLTRTLQRRAKHKGLGEALEAMRKDQSPPGRAAMAAMVLEADRILDQASAAYAQTRAV